MHKPLELVVCSCAKVREIDAQSDEQVLLQHLAQGDRAVFWNLWQRHQTYLHHRCRVWLTGIAHDPEEALSRVMLKAWEKLPAHAGNIVYLRAWLTRLTYHLCMDIHREHRRGAMATESIETMGSEGNDFLFSGTPSPESALLNQELQQSIRSAINNLNPQLRVPFILRYDRQLSCQEIAQQLALSPDTVYKRIQQARTILKRRLKKYLAGLDETLNNGFQHSSQIEIFEKVSIDIPKDISRNDPDNPFRNVSEEFSVNSSGIKQMRPDVLRHSDIQTLLNEKHLSNSISYKITGICLENLSRTWFQSPRLMG